MTSNDSTSSDAVQSGPVLPPSFPTFDSIRVRIPIVADEMTIWPAPKESYWQWVEGFPYELHPFAWDYLWISCDGYQVEIKPHYLDSTWDTFWTDGTGYVTAQALGGLFPFTLGKEVNLIKGIVSTLDALPPLVVKKNPEDATKIQQIHGILKAIDGSIESAADPSAGVSSLRRAVSEFIWRRKLAHLFASNAGGAS